MTSDSKEFTAILSRVPKWHMLAHGEDIIKRGDMFMPPENYGTWLPVVHENEFGLIYDRNSCLCVRPIPEHVRRSEAWWALYNKLATVAPRIENTGFGYELYPSGIHIYTETGFQNDKGPDLTRTHNLFETREAARNCIYALGGEQEIIKNLQEGPGAYMRWVLQ